MPVYAHLPLILDPSGVGKLSKRKKQGEGDEELLTFIREYREAGYLPEAMFNFLADHGLVLQPGHRSVHARAGHRQVRHRTTSTRPPARCR